MTLRSPDATVELRLPRSGINVLVPTMPVHGSFRLDSMALLVRRLPESTVVSLVVPMKDDAREDAELIGCEGTSREWAAFWLCVCVANCELWS